MIRRLLFVMLSAWVVMSAGGCGVSDGAPKADRLSTADDFPAAPNMQSEADTLGQSGAVRAEPSTPTQVIAPGEIKPTTTRAIPQSESGIAGPVPTISLAETASLVQADLATTLQAPVDQIAVTDPAPAPGRIKG